MITIEFLGETENGRPCNCTGGSRRATVTKKKIFGKLWEVGKPQAVSIDEFDKYMMTGLFETK